MDISLIQAEKNIQLFPRSIFGILWLQTHFDSTHWEALASSQVQIPKDDINSLMKDATAAGLKLDLRQNLCINKNF